MVDRFRADGRDAFLGVLGLPENDADAGDSPDCAFGLVTGGDIDLAEGKS